MKLQSLLLIALIAINAKAQEQTDSLAVHEVELGEVSVTASRVIRKADRNVYTVSDKLKQSSTSTLNLIGHLQIPTVIANDVMNTLTSEGHDIQIRINGREATIEQLKAIDINSIQRVEYIDNPGLRYDGAHSVIDIIVKNPTSGGAFQGNALQMLTHKFGNAFANLQLNTGKSQWELYAFGSMRDQINIYREYNDKYQMPDGSTVVRSETPIDGDFKGNYFSSTAAYNYVNPDKTNFYASLNLWRNADNGTKFYGLMTPMGSDNKLYVTDQSHSPNTGTTLDLYLDQDLGRQQTLILSFSGNISNGRSYHDYIETDAETEAVITDISTRLKNRDHSIYAEGNYVKKWDKSMLTTGIRFNAQRNRSAYLTGGNEVIHSSSDRLYLFAEYMHRLGKFTLTGGLAMTYRNSDTDGSLHRNETTNFTPRLSVNWRYCDASRFTFSYDTSTTAPTIDETAPVAQQIDSYQTQIGNPDLKSYQYHNLRFQYSFSSDRFSITPRVSWYYENNSIMPFYSFKDNHIIKTWDNQGQYHSIYFRVSPTLTIVPDWVTLSGSVQFQRQFSRGNGFRRALSDWSGDANLEITHYGFTLGFECEIPRKNLSGETIMQGEYYNMISLTYTYRNWNFTAAMFIPFGHYKQVNTLDSKYIMQHSVYRSHIERAPLISISYSTSWGRKGKSAQRLIENDIESSGNKAVSR